MCLLVACFYPRLPAPGGRIFGSSTAILFEPGTSAQHRSAQSLCPKGNKDHAPSICIPCIWSPRLPSTGPRDLWPGPGDQLLASWARWAKFQECRGQNNVCGREDLLRPLLGFSFSFLKAGKSSFLALSTTWCCFGGSYREESPPPLQLGKRNEPSKRGQARLRKRTVR